MLETKQQFIFLFLIETKKFESFEKYFCNKEI